MSQLAADSGGLSKDEVFTILKNRRRRLVIRYLQDHGGGSTVRELTEEVAARETNQPVEELNYDQRKAVYTSLYQTHLPKLDSVGVIDYDRRSGRVVLAEGVHDLDVHLAVADGGSTSVDDSRPLGRWVALGGVHVVLGLVAGWLLATGAGWLVALGVAAILVATAGVWYRWYQRVSADEDRRGRPDVSGTEPEPSD